MITAAIEVDHTIGAYILIASDSEVLDFDLSEFSSEDAAWLEARGFINPETGSNGEIVSAYRTDLNHIWLYKIEAVLRGKDIWSMYLEDICNLVFLCQVVFGGLALVMLVVMINNITHSVTLKLSQRNRYIQMLESLGCNVRTVCSVYMLVFLIRIIIAFVIAVPAGSFLMCMVNRYLQKELLMSTTFSVIRPDLIAISFCLIIVLLCRKIKSICKENN